MPAVGQDIGQGDVGVLEPAGQAAGGLGRGGQAAQPRRPASTLRAQRRQDAGSVEHGGRAADVPVQDAPGRRVEEALQGDGWCGRRAAPTCSARSSVIGCPSSGRPGTTVISRARHARPASSTTAGDGCAASAWTRRGGHRQVRRDARRRARARASSMSTTSARFGRVRHLEHEPAVDEHVEVALAGQRVEYCCLDVPVGRQDPLDVALTEVRGGRVEDVVGIRRHGQMLPSTAAQLRTERPRDGRRVGAVRRPPVAAWAVAEEPGGFHAHADPARLLQARVGDDHGDEVPSR